MSNIRVLIADRCIQSTTQLSEQFAENNIDLDFAYHGISALELMIKNEYDILIIDSKITKLDALSLTKKMRQQLFSSVPIILLAANDELTYKIEGFEAGVDDILVKPYAPQELYYRLKAVSKRGPLRGIGQQEINDLLVDYNASTVSRGDRKIKLHQMQMRIIKVLAQHYPNTVSREVLEQEIWAGALPESSPLRTHIYRLRQSIKDQLDRDIISTVYAKGYRLA
ncbi:response regulator transcription factor [Psychrobium sp. MM17-31]|uniref:response regulator transcription factor n=1 Tax=Psychrobium sp. MM17-31 TaxID=2917758 RepID=UPI001EF70CFA|nr:response regulator transcription factor [Psychrobium sp. MM17-31]MCG7533348.1 response regulator transcription factor [Psychrobium sp. MM17-31]